MTARRGKRYSTRSRGAKFAKINDERKQEASEVVVEETLERIPKDEGTEVIEDLVGGGDKEVSTPEVVEVVQEVSETPVEKETPAVAVDDALKPIKASVKATAKEPVKKKAQVKPKKKPAKKVATAI